MKRCPFCAEEIQDQAIKCRFCGSSLAQGAPQAAAAGFPPQQAAAAPYPYPPGTQAYAPSPSGQGYAQSPAQAAPPVHNAPNAGGKPPLKPGERILFQGSPSWRASLGSYVLAVIVMILGVAVGIGVAIATKNPILGLSGLSLVIGAAVWMLVLHLSRTSRKVRITLETIDVEYGIFGRRIETMQLWKIRDSDFSQSFWERLMGIARIHILSSDAQQPNILLVGLPGSRLLFDELRDAVSLARQAKNVVGFVQ